MGFETLIPRLYGFRDSDSENVSKNCLHGPCSADSPTLLRMKIWHTWIVWVCDSGTRVVTVRNLPFHYPTLHQGSLGLEDRHLI